MTSNEKFVDYPLRDEVKQAVLDCGYETPTAVQAQIIPHMMKQRDVLAQSQTGTGKTAAFALPILSTISLEQGKGKRKPQVIVLAPTRELAIQVAKSFTTYSKNLAGFSVAAIYGGQDYEPQLAQLRRGVQVVVGTPGRVIDHVKRGTLDLSEIRCLVLDEADEMLNMGFLEDVQFVLKHLPEERQIALFSATMPGPIKEIAKKYLNDPARVTVQDKTVTAESIRQRAMFVPPREKNDALFRLLEVEETDGVIVFTKTKDATITVAEALGRQGYSAIALNGDMPQKVRSRAVDQLKSGRLNILVATDVAARGLDVPRISHVINYDLPHDSESYIHRVGRTGRAGRKGEAILLLSNAQRGKLRHIERVTRQPIEIMDVPSTKQVNEGRIKKFGDEITKTIADKDLTLFKDLIGKYAEENGQPIEMIAAAVADMTQRGRPFLMKDRPQPKRDSFREERDHDRRGRRDNFSREDRGAPRERIVKPVEAGMVRYRISVGWRDGVKPGNIVGAVANEAGIEGSYIGPINIRDADSTIDLPEGMPQDIYQQLRRTFVSGKRLNLEVARESDGSDSGYSGKRSFKGGKRNFKKSGPKQHKTFSKHRGSGSTAPSGKKRQQPSK